MAVMRNLLLAFLILLLPTAVTAGSDLVALVDAKGAAYQTARNKLIAAGDLPAVDPTRPVSERILADLVRSRIRHQKIAAQVDAAFIASEEAARNQSPAEAQFPSSKLIAAAVELQAKGDFAAAGAIQRGCLEWFWKLAVTERQRTEALQVVYAFSKNGDRITDLQYWLAAYAAKEVPTADDVLLILRIISHDEPMEATADLLAQVIASPQLYSHPRMPHVVNVLIDTLDDAARERLRALIADQPPVSAKPPDGWQANQPQVLPEGPGILKVDIHPSPPFSISPE